MTRRHEATNLIDFGVFNWAHNDAFHFGNCTVAWIPLEASIASAECVCSIAATRAFRDT